MQSLYVIRLNWAIKNRERNAKWKFLHGTNMFLPKTPSLKPCAVGKVSSCKITLDRKFFACLATVISGAIRKDSGIFSRYKYHRLAFVRYKSFPYNRYILAQNSHLMNFVNIVTFGALAAVATAANGSNGSNGTTTTFSAGAVQGLNGGTIGAGLAAVAAAALLI